MNIAILDDYTGDALAMADWASLGATITVFDAPIPEAERAARLAPFDVLCLMRERMPLGAELIAALPALKLVVTSGMRNLAIDMAAARARGVTVCGTGSRKTTTSELALLLLLALARRLGPESASLAAGGWQRALGRDLAGLTLGLVGLGNIGGQMAALGQALGMRVVAWSPNLDAARAEALGVLACPSLHALMAQADAVSVHVVLSERSRGMIDAAALDAMKPDAMLVNTSRGPVVDTRALLATLRARPLMSAALDVFDTEPLPPGHPLLAPDLTGPGRLLLTPHLGYATRETFRRFHAEAVEDIAAWAAGTPLRRLD
ncbi:D-2-hydroxyacid dehydrogenase family protein (plasmid) [Paroceanicella profunda]|uniref:D-2-hydroxyacid dehydrogenase family protein n=1 Tax=Paroceanicella profunda TaxID=2579971 RepID=A0A5B8G559_9RHOB|nr:D-2-hydroxyacid dehydrogenase family protein [Paroceanicella profunda]QDL94442.1 D-2-hydroxyacid dehydrogenase family protein [Paroceanicella profunda]